MPLKGTSPVNPIKVVTPKDHTSTPKPEYPLSDIISGAKYTGVPICSKATKSYFIFLEIPKSQIFILSLLSNSKLSNLTSLCNI